MAEGWQDRLRVERQELADRLSKLQSFLEVGLPEVMPLADHILLQSQAKVMEHYLWILDRRIWSLNPDER